MKIFQIDPFDKHWKYYTVIPTSANRQYWVNTSTPW